MKTVETINSEIDSLRRELETVQGTETEVYTRIVGYYRSLRNWNRGKREEYRHRRLFTVNDDAARTDVTMEAPNAASEPDSGPAVREAEVLTGLHATLYYRQTCPGCPPVKRLLAETGTPANEIDVDTEAGAAAAFEQRIYATPTVVFSDDDGNEACRATDAPSLKSLLAGARAATYQPA